MRSAIPRGGPASPLFEINTEIERPDPELVRQLAEIPVANLSDAAANLNTMHSDIQALIPGARICGPACTVSNRGGDFLATLKGLFAAQPGDVLVIDAQGNPDMAVWGEITTAEAQRKGLAGLVADAKVRDIAGIRKANFPVFARGTTPRVAGRNSLGEVNVPIQCGGVVVRPGDIIAGDSDGVVVVAREKAAEILRLGREIIDFEVVLMAKVKAGLTQVEFFALDALFETVRASHMTAHSQPPQE